MALLVAIAAGGTAGTQAADFRDGALLAAKDLAADTATLTVFDTGGQPTAANTHAAEAIAAGTKLIIGPTAQSEVTAVDAAVAGRLPIFALVSNSGPRPKGVFAFLSDESDSAIQVSSYAVARGKKRILAIAPPGYRAAHGDRLSRGLAGAGAELVDLIEYGGGGDVLDKAKPQIAQSDAVLIMALPTSPAAIIAAAKATGALSTEAIFLGTTGWSKRLYQNSALSGVYIAAPDQDAMQEISDRFNKAYGRPISLDAACAYDAMALAAGIVRTKGSQGLKPATLQGTSGFRGSTGLFRFQSNGSVERLFPIYQLADKQLKLVEAAPAGF